MRGALYWTLEGRVLGFTLHPRLMNLAENGPACTNK
jgi:hypothetical protein